MAFNGMFKVLSIFSLPLMQEGWLVKKKSVHFLRVNSGELSPSFKPNNASYLGLNLVQKVLLKIASMTPLLKICATTSSEGDASLVKDFKLSKRLCWVKGIVNPTF